MFLCVSFPLMWSIFLCNAPPIVLWSLKLFSAVRLPHRGTSCAHPCMKFTTILSLYTMHLHRWTAASCKTSNFSGCVLLVPYWLPSSDFLSSLLTYLLAYVSKQASASKQANVGCWLACLAGLFEQASLCKQASWFEQAGLFDSVVNSSVVSFSFHDVCHDLWWNDPCSITFPYPSTSPA